MPNETEARGQSYIFKQMCGIPGIIATIDGTHIPILPPQEGYRDFVNRKGWPSYNVQAIVDSQYRKAWKFRDITCKHPGCTHDATVLKDSNVYKNVGNIMPKDMINVDGMNIPYFIIGDPAYPLLPWLIKNYKHYAITPEEESFNTYLNRGRVVVEYAFRRLKARWGCLLKRLDIYYEFVPTVVLTCVILHNIVESQKEKFVDQWLQSVEAAELEFPKPQTKPTADRDSLQGFITRDHLKYFMANNFLLRRSHY